MCHNCALSIVCQGLFRSRAKSGLADGDTHLKELHWN